MVLTVAFVALVPLLAPPSSMQQAPQKRPIELEDIISWKSIVAPAVSNDGQWFAYRLAPGEGDAQVVVKRARSDKEMTFDIGEPPAAGGGGPQGPAAATTLDFSADSKWIAFSTYPTRAEAQRLRRQRRPVQSGVTVVNLATGEKRDYPKIRRFAFSGDTGTWLALQRHPAQTGPGGGAASGGGPGGPGGAPQAGPNAAPDRPRGTDLILRELASGQELNVGNVADFAFSRDGRFLAWTIDAQDKVGNGIQLRDMTRGTVSVLDSGLESYDRP
jgi:hypothetical protein